MSKSKIQPEKIWLAFAVITIICGVLLIFEKNYISGISGSIVGCWLAFENWKKLKDSNSQKIR
jgi:hypothetical protein